MDVKERTAFFAEYDKNLKPNPCADKFSWFVFKSGWKPSDGVTEGVFERYPVGSRVLWGCRWNTSEGLVRPVDLLPTDKMTLLQMVWELADGTYLPADVPAAAMCGQVITAYHHQPAGTSWAQWVKAAHQAINAARMHYKEYLCSWDLPAQVKDYRAARPGYSDVYQMRKLIIEQGKGYKER